MNILIHNPAQPLMVPTSYGVMTVEMLAHSVVHADGVRRPVGFAYFVRNADDCRSKPGFLQLTEWYHSMERLHRRTAEGIPVEKDVTGEPAWPEIEAALQKAGAIVNQSYTV